MTDEDLTGAPEARERARLLLAEAAQRRAGAVPDDRGSLISRAEAMARAEQLREAMAREPAESAPGPEQPHGLHAPALSELSALLRDVAAYLGDRPQRDAEAMALYGRVMSMLGSENVQR